MYPHTLTPSQFARYTKILEVQPHAPNIEVLTEIIRTHLAKIPFENISKLYYKNKLGVRGLVSLDQYLDGIEQYHFGGTCYATNYYLHLFLKRLGYDVSLCGADMSRPDVHIVNIVKLDGREYIVDVGYAAPFLTPLPGDIQTEYRLSRQSDLYVLKPRDEKKRSRLDMFREGELLHGYTVNPLPRQIEEFTNTIEASFNDSATFMNAVLLVRFTEDSSCTIHNTTCIEWKGVASEKRTASSRNELASLINEKFQIPLPALNVALENISLDQDAWN